MEKYEEENRRAVLFRFDVMALRARTVNFLSMLDALIVELEKPFDVRTKKKEQNAG